MIDKLLIPVDGSAPAKRAAKFGLELAAVYDAAVDVLHVVDGRSREHGTRIIDEALDVDVDGDPTVARHQVEGKPATSIASHVTDADTDLVVMGRYGRSGVSDHLLGSVSERVLRNVTVPVVSVPGETVDRETGREYGDVLLTTDGSEEAERAGPYATDIARRTAATLHLLTVVDVQAEAGPFDAGGVDREYVERLENRGQDALDSLADTIDAGDVDVRSSIVKGDTAEEIRAYADEHDVGLLAISSEGQTNLVGQRLGSIASRLLGSVKRPILVVPILD